MVLDQGWAELADGGSRKTFFAGGLEDGLLVEVVAAKIGVDVAEHPVIFEEGGDGRADLGHGDRLAGVNGVGVIAVVAGPMAGGERCGVRRGEGREDRMAVGEAHAAGHQRRDGGRGLFIDHAGAQAIGDEQQDIFGFWLRAGGQGQQQGEDE